MAAVVGYGGSVKWANGLVAEIDEWSIDVDADMIEVTAFQEIWKRYLAGLNGWTGSLSGRFDGQDAAQKAMLAAISAGTSAEIEFLYDDTHSFKGTAFLSAAGITASVSSSVDASYDAQGTGALTLPDSD